MVEYSVNSRDMEVDEDDPLHPNYKFYQMMKQHPPEYKFPPIYDEEYFRPQIEAHWRSLPIWIRDPDLLTDKKY